MTIDSIVDCRKDAVRMPSYPVEPVLVVDRFTPMLDALLALLHDLDDAAWDLPTAVPGWSVKTIAAHLLGGDVGILSRQRDGHSTVRHAPAQWQDLVSFVNEWNGIWVAATERVSPRLLCDLLRFTGDQVSAFFGSRDPWAIGGPVSWAGPMPAPVWLDLAREYTERWHHQQQIRGAVARPGLTDPPFLAPVLATFVHALPHSFRDVHAPDGTRIALDITGDAGARWLLERQVASWHLFRSDEPASAEVTLDADTAWRLFTRGLGSSEAEKRAAVTGDKELARRLFHAVAVIA
jgi:uncharacterized protein (TIGR03083 family)